MADPQFGMFSSISKLSKSEVIARKNRGINVTYSEKELEGFEEETELFTRAIEAANEINPAFVVVCGDMVHDPESTEQLEELFRVSNLLREDIKLYWVPGNHDVGDKPTTASLEKYIDRFGDYNYSFREENCYCIVLNSAICYDPELVPDEWDNLISFLRKELETASRSNITHKIIFMHHPLYLNEPNEDDNYFVIPLRRRSIILDLLAEHEVTALCTGHLHKNNYKNYGTTELISTGSVGYPLGKDPSGIRIIELTETKISHRYLSLES